MDDSVAQHLRPAVIVQRRGLVLAAALIATFMPAVESTIVATAMPTIVGELGGFRLFSWVFAAYLLAMAVTIPVYGRLADMYGRKHVFFAGTAIFMLGTALCGFAHNMPMLVLFRALQGLGGGAIQPIASTIVGDIYTPAERARVQGYISSVFGISAVVGPALGAFLVLHVHWSVVFWLNLPIGLVAIAMFAAFLPEHVDRRSQRIDYLGGALLVVGVGALMLALIQAITLSRDEIAALAGLGAAALIALALYERSIAEPMLPLALWRLRLVVLSNLGGFGASATMMAVAALLPTYVQGVMGRGPGTVGFVVGATSVSWMFASFAAGRLMIATSYRATAAIGGVALVAGTLVLVTLTPNSGPLWAAGGALLIGVAMGFCNTTFLVAIQATVGLYQRGVGTGSQMFMRMIGQSVGAAVYGAIINFGVLRRLPEAADSVSRLLDPTLRQRLGADLVARLGDAVGWASHRAFLVAFLIALATLAATLALPARISPVRPARP